MGAGRTELARAIFGLDKISSGSIYIKGVAQKMSSPRSAIKSGIGFLTVANAGWAHAIGVACFFGFILSGFRAALPPGIVDAGLVDEEQL